VAVHDPVGGQGDSVWLEVRPAHRGFLTLIVGDDDSEGPSGWRGRCLCGWSGPQQWSRDLAEEDMIGHLMSVDWAPYMIDVELPPFP
jgi:hypothetical protein